MSNSVWGGNNPSVAWNENSWASNVLTVSLTAPAASTASVGSVTAFHEEGWGRQEWGNSGWGVDYAVQLSGLGATSSLGSLTAAQTITAELTAPSTLTSSLGSLTTTQLSIAALTAPSQMTSQLGDFDNAGTLVGWGRNGWGEEPYGDSFNKLVQPAGLSATASVGAIAPADVMGLTGVSATTSVGAIAPADVVGLTGLSATTSVGSITPEIGEAISGLGATSSVGSITPADVVGLTGLGSTVSVGSITVTETQLVTITAPSGLTSSVGSIISQITVPLTAPSSLTASVGSIAPANVVGITGLEATVSLGEVGGPIAWSLIEPSQDGNWSQIIL